MKFIELSLRGVWLIEPEVFSDERGAFRRHFCADEFGAHGLAPTVAQRFSLSSGWFRGGQDALMHDRFDL